MKRLLAIQSVSDIITNSSSEVFIISKEDCLHYIDKYDDKFNQCFHEVKKLTKRNLLLEPWYKYDFETPNDIMWEEVLHILRISEEQAVEDGLLLEKKKYFSHTDEKGHKVYEHYWDPVWNWKASKKKREEMMDKFCESWIAFTGKHKKEIEDKIIGTYWICVEDHFDKWSEFREEIIDKGYLYYESRH